LVIASVAESLTTVSLASSVPSSQLASSSLGLRTNLLLLRLLESRFDKHVARISLLLGQIQVLLATLRFPHLLHLKATLILASVILELLLFVVQRRVCQILLTTSSSAQT